VVPDHTSLKEIFDGVPRIACHGSETDRNYGLERPLPEPESLAELLTAYYDDRSLLAEHGQWCYGRIHHEAFTWPYIQKQMLGIVENLLKTPAEKEFKGFGSPVKIN
jgi:glycosyltransferase involved in cell wall biosynthesis